MAKQGQTTIKIRPPIKAKHQSRPRSLTRRKQAANDAAKTNTTKEHYRRCICGIRRSAAISTCESRTMYMVLHGNANRRRAGAAVFDILKREGASIFW